MINDAMSRSPKSQKAHLSLVEQWKNVPEGTPVIVTKDDGTEFKTKTRSFPWMLGSSSRGPGHTAVILVEGISGGYGLWRVRLDSVNVQRFEEGLMEEIRIMTCGCCTNGCVCRDHRDEPRLPEQKCDTHKDGKVK